MKIVLSFCLFLYVTFAQDPVTPLQKYVHYDDKAMSWTVHNIVRGPSYDTYVINMTSQFWLTPSDVSISTWYHFLNIAVPHNLDINSPYGVVFADDGDRNGKPSTNGDQMAGIVAVNTGNLVAHLHDIPNEPGKFWAEKPTPKQRSEGALLAYGWSHFLNNTNQPEWIVELPMTKAIIKAMDVLTEFALQYKFGNISKFINTGASKRGWVTWLSAACDPRIVAIVPIVMPILNTQRVLNKMYQSVGWTFALSDYIAENIMLYINTPEFTKLTSIIDPMVYYSSLSKIPKYLVTATGDEFFIPDAHREFWSEVPGLKYMRVVPNCDHSMIGHIDRILRQASTFMNHFKNNTLIPNMKSQLVYSNTTATTTVWPQGKPSSVTMWTAYTLSSTLRDFRLVNCLPISKCFNPVFWIPSTLKPKSDGSYVASVSAPLSGWAGFFIEIAYGDENEDDFWEITSEVNIVPDIYPNPPCADNGSCLPPSSQKERKFPKMTRKHY